MNLYKKCTAKPYSFLVIDTTLVSDNSSRFRKDLLEKIKKLIMTIDVKILDEKIQYHINRRVVKISALSSSKIDKKGQKISPSDQSRIKEQVKFTYTQ